MENNTIQFAIQSIRQGIPTPFVLPVGVTLLWLNRGVGEGMNVLKGRKIVFPFKSKEVNALSGSRKSQRNPLPLRPQL